MLSVPAFKRSLSAGILDVGSSEILLGGLRQSRFMKDIENATGRMGEGDTMPPAEEFGTAAARMDGHALAAAVADEPILADALAAIASLLRSGGR